MGFIDYHGTKVDRYTDVLEYSRAQQEEDWRRKDSEKVELWLRDHTGSSSYARLRVDDLIKYVITKYRALKENWIDLIKLMKRSTKVDEALLWSDFSIDLAARHMSAFHLTVEKRNRYLQVFQEKVFRLEKPISAEEHYQRIDGDIRYRRYFTECFDPTWKGQHFFKWLRVGIEKNKEGLQLLNSFLDTDIQLCLFLGLYLHMVIMPHDDSWMREIDAERTALFDIRGKIHRGTLFAPDMSLLVNPVSRKQAKIQGEDESDVLDNGAITESEALSVPDSGLDKKKFTALVQKGTIPDYVTASKLLVDCELPEEINQIYQQLIERMPILQDAVDRFDDIYHADVDQFMEYYAPEALKITSVYLDYQAASPSEKVLKETRDGVLLATKKLLQVVNEKIDEIYKFVTIDANAEAKALETLMSQDGHVDPEYRIK